MSKTTKLKPPSDEPTIQALAWAKGAYGRKLKERFAFSLEQHMKNVPPGIPVENWHLWYFAPFGVPEWNQHTILLRKYFNNEEPPEGFSLPEPFSWRKALGVFGVNTEQESQCSE